jgi:hypothetical protein
MIVFPANIDYVPGSWGVITRSVWIWLVCTEYIQYKQAIHGGMSSVDSQSEVAIVVCML